MIKWTVAGILSLLLVSLAESMGVTKWLEAVQPLRYIGAESIYSHCTAFHINADNYYWMTASHCIKPDLAIYVGGYRAFLVKNDEKADLAILRVPGAKASTLPLRSSPMKIDELVFLVGFPFGRVYPYITSGTILSNEGELIGRDELYTVYMAACKTGSSGSPILDIRGKVVSVNQVGIIEDRKDFHRICAGVQYQTLKDFAQNYFQGA